MTRKSEKPRKVRQEKKKNWGSQLSSLQMYVFFWVANVQIWGWQMSDKWGWQMSAWQMTSPIGGITTSIDIFSIISFIGVAIYVTLV